MKIARRTILLIVGFALTMCLGAPAAFATERIDNEHVVTTKSVAYNEADSNYTLTMDAYVTGGSSVTESITNPAASDIVLVIDTTGSMLRCVDCNEKEDDCTCGQSGGAYKSRMEAIVDAVDAFLKTLEESGIDHRVAVVTFDYNAEVLRTKTDGSLDFLNTANAASGYASLQYYPVNQYHESIVSMLKKIDPDYATYPNTGISMAKSVLSSIDSGDRSRSVVFFSDGKPTTTNSCMSALATAKDVKDMGVTIYTVGCYPGADGSDPTVPSFNTVSKYVNNNINDNDYELANPFLMQMSSNYPNATGSGSTWTPGDLNSSLELEDGKLVSSYAFGADNSAALTKAFVGIASSITSGGADIELGSTTVMRDEVASKDFTIVLDAIEGTPSVRAYSMTCTGLNSEDGSYVWKETADDKNYDCVVSGENNNIVEVSGFNYSENWVGAIETTAVDGTKTTVYRGKKLVLEITIDKHSNHLGGADINTNIAANSGIFTPANDTEAEKTIELFDMPTVDLPTTVTLAKKVKAGDAEAEDESADAKEFQVGVHYYYGLGEFQTTTGSGNKVQATSAEWQSFVTLKDGADPIVFKDKLLIGSAMTLIEVVNSEDYSVKVEVYDPVTGETTVYGAEAGIWGMVKKKGSDGTPGSWTEGSSGEGDQAVRFDIPVSPGMQVTLVNTQIEKPEPLPETGGPSEKTELPATGDATPLLLFTGIACACALLMATSLVMRRRRG